MTAAQTPTSFSMSGASTLAASLQTRLFALPFPAFAELIGTLLTRIGYTQVQLAGRTRWKGRNQHGGGSGFDLIAALPSPVSEAVSPRRVVVSLKRFGPEQAIHQRDLDQLRGACLRVGANEGLLITTGPVSPSVRASQAALLAPVAVLDGDKLLGLLIQHRVGVAEEEGYLRLDAALFARLAQGNMGSDPARSSRVRPTSRTINHPVTPVRVTVQVEPLPTAR